MKLITFKHEGNLRIGNVIGEQVVDLNYACQLLLKSQGKYRYKQLAEAHVPADMVGFLEGGEESMRLAEEATKYALSFPQGDSGWKVIHQYADLRVETPVQMPSKIICVGHNYREHIKEMGRELPSQPVIFAKFANTLLSPQDDILYPSVTNQLDYEAELAFVIGKQARNVSQQQAMDYVAGYAVANDVTSRDLQRRTIQWLQGKTVEGSLPLGPWIVTREEIADPYCLGIELRVNGELRQKTNTANFVFNVHYLVEFLSSIMTLEPGDIVLTGTPGGVGVAMDPPVFLQDGDIVRIDIEQIGTLENKVKKGE